MTIDNCDRLSLIITPLPQGDLTPSTPRRSCDLLYRVTEGSNAVRDHLVERLRIFVNRENENETEKETSSVQPML